MSVPALRTLVKTGLSNVASAARSRRTSRTTLLALAELVRRLESPLGTFPTLTPYELKVLSQNGEDGVIAEILKRSGEGNRFFVEFGAADGLECNCAVLADVLGWRGLFMEADERAYARLAGKYRSHSGVATRRAMVTSDRIEALFTEGGVSEEFTLLSIDVDGAEYWIWEALQSFRPRVVVIEYNGSLDAERRLTQPRGVSESWDQTVWHGASIGALRSLASSKGYRLVHTELTGTNAFFVRSDLPGEYPPEGDVPMRASNHHLAGGRHLPDPARRPFLDLDTGELTDGYPAV